MIFWPRDENGIERSAGVPALMENDRDGEPLQASIAVLAWKDPRNRAGDRLMTTQDVANQLVKLCSQGKFQEATENLYSADIVSVEASAPPGQSRESKGIEAVKSKGEWWAANHDVHSVKVEGPLVAGSHFAVTFELDVTFKPENKPFHMEEVAVYKVAEGKIVSEEFFYTM